MHGSMNDSHSNNVNELRLIARVVGLLAALTGMLYVRVFLDEGLLVFTTAGLNGYSLLLPLLIVAGVLGLLATMRWEGIGGTVATLSGLALGLSILLMGRGWLDAFFYGSPFIVAGGLALWCHWRA